MTIEEIKAQVELLELNAPRAFIIADAAGMLLAYSAVFASRDMPSSATEAKNMADRLNNFRRELLGVPHVNK